MDRVDSQDGFFPVGDGGDLPDQPIVVEYREGEVTPPALGGRLLHLERVLELEQLLRPGAVVDEPVERR